MKKSELIKEIAKETDLTQVRTKKVIEALTDIITRELSNGGNVKIDGLGSFRTVIYNKHNIKAINGGAMQLEARLSPRFKPSVKLKEAIKENRKPEAGKAG